jgi:hypothetical protein
VTPFLSLPGIATATFPKAFTDPPDLLGRDQRTNPAEDCKTLAGRWIRADETVDERSAGGEMENSISPPEAASKLLRGLQRMREPTERRCLQVI